MTGSGTEAAGVPAVAGADDQSAGFEAVELVGDGAGAGEAYPLADLPEVWALAGLGCWHLATLVGIASLVCAKIRGWI